MSFLSDLLTHPLGPIPEAIFGKKAGDTINQLPLDALVMPITGAMAASGPKSNNAAHDVLGFLYGKDQIPSTQLDWLDMNTKLQPMPAKKTSFPNNSAAVIQPINMGG